ncbi:uncharacterized protein LOC144348581 [Saccoglossus kowalevskii]
MSAHQLRAHCRDQLRHEIGILTTKSGGIADAVATRLTQTNITKLYIAAPDYENAIISVMKRRFPFTKAASDVILPGKYKSDNYVYSLVDQEISQRSDYFIKSGFSMWSAFVAFFRESMSKTTIDIQDLPGYPEAVRKLHLWMK